MGNSLSLFLFFYSLGVLDWFVVDLWLQAFGGKAVRLTHPNGFCLGNDGGKWVIPFSWKTVYGPPPDMSMF